MSGQYDMATYPVIAFHFKSIKIEVIKGIQKCVKERYMAIMFVIYDIIDEEGIQGNGKWQWEP